MSLLRIFNIKEISTELKKELFQRSQIVLDSIMPEVENWVYKIKSEGDRAIEEYMNKFSGKKEKLTQNRFRITFEEVNEALENIDKALLKQMKKQMELSRKFHNNYFETITKFVQFEQLEGVSVGYKKVPIESVGLYVPAGKAPLPTVAQILTIAAKSAGVKRIAVFFPATSQKNEQVIIASAALAGADEIYRIGGVAAIAAMAYGTECIKRVDKIAGPGSPWVQAAKLLVVDKVGIDMFSGPSEAAILCDSSSNPKFIAADILARCEHGPDSAVLVLSTSKDISSKVAKELDSQIINLKRQDYIRESLSRFCAVINVQSESEMIELCNEYAPEHLEIQTNNPKLTFEGIKNAGSVFIGSYAPVAVGDYASGTNHCLPTGNAVKYSSPVSPETFLKTVQFQELTEAGLKNLLPIVETISDAEGLDAHKISCQIRF
jgi:histidinol dehydrogenase